MILGAYSTRDGGGGRPLARIVQVSIAPLDTHRFRVGIHEEGTGLTFRQEIYTQLAKRAPVASGRTATATRPQPGSRFRRRLW